MKLHEQHQLSAARKREMPKGRNNSISQGQFAPAPVAGPVVFVVYSHNGSVVSAGNEYPDVARALGCLPDNGPPWLATVVERLTAGLSTVVREDRAVAGSSTVHSEHVLMSSASDKRILIGSRFQVAAARASDGPIAAQRLFDVLRLSSEWLFETAADLTITFISDRVYDDLGLVPARVIGRSLPQLGVFDDGPRLLCRPIEH